MLGHVWVMAESPQCPFYTAFILAALLASIGRGQPKLACSEPVSVPGPAVLAQLLNGPGP